MALKGPLWLMGKCLDQERARGRISHLAGRALDLGLRKTDSTRGHVFQAIGALQNFFEDFPQHKASARAASPVEFYKPHGQELKDWRAFIDAHDGSFGRASFGYDYGTLKVYLTPKYGGHRKGGGGGDNEFEIIWRLLAEQ